MKKQSLTFFFNRIRLFLLTVNFFAITVSNVTKGMVMQKITQKVHIFQFDADGLISSEPQRRVRCFRPHLRPKVRTGVDPSF